MSFIDTYIKKYRVGDISNKTRKNLKKIENQLDSITKKAKNGLSFLDAIKNHGHEIGDLIERVHQHFDGWKLTWTNSFSAFQFVYSISMEVYQIVDMMNDEVIPDGLTGDKAWQAKKKFGQELVYFIWSTIDPLKKGFNWIPFKKTIEKKLVIWLAGLGMESAKKFFMANKEISGFSTNNSAGLMKAL